MLSLWIFVEGCHLVCRFELLSLSLIILLVLNYFGLSFGAVEQLAVCAHVIILKALAHYSSDV